MELKDNLVLVTANKFSTLAQSEIIESNKYVAGKIILLFTAVRQLTETHKNMENMQWDLLVPTININLVYLEWKEIIYARLSKKFLLLRVERFMKLNAGTSPLSLTRKRIYMSGEPSSLMYLMNMRDQVKTNPKLNQQLFALSNLNLYQIWKFQPLKSVNLWL